MTGRVMLIADLPVFRLGLRAMLEGSPNLEVVDDFDVSEDIGALVDKHSPDVALFGLDHPCPLSVERVTSLSAEDTDTKVMVIGSLDEHLITEAIRAGVYGYLLRESSSDTIRHAVQVVLAGGTVFSPQIAKRISHALRQELLGAERGQFSALTEREREVLELVARGYGNRNIAQELFLAEKTIRNHVSNLLAKLQINSRAEMIVLARNAGLGAA